MISLGKEDYVFSELMEGYLRNLFDEKDISPEKSKELIKFYYDKLSKGLNSGYNSKSEFFDENLSNSLKNNISQFTAFKEASYKNELVSLLNSDKSLSWSNFKKQASSLDIQYNKRWLETEFHHTVATANAVEQWKSYEADSDLYPNLKYNAVNDSRTREKHRALDGFIAPINHPIWKKLAVPNDWGCRCNLEQTDEDPSTKIPDLDVKSGFNNNAALSGNVFTDIAYKDELTSDDVKRAETLSSRLLEVDNYKPSVLKKYKNGGKIESSNLVNTTDSDYKDLLKCCTEFAKKGNLATILPKVHVNSPLYKNIFGDLVGTVFDGKCPDIRIGNLFYELEGYEGLPNSKKLSKMLSRGLKQSTRLIIQDEGSSINHYLKVIKFRIKEGQMIDEVWILRSNGKLEQIY